MASRARPARRKRDTEVGRPSTAATAARIARAHPRPLDRLVHDRVRLGLLSALAVSSSLTFGELKAMLQTSDGNLSVHARKLEEAGYIACRKSFAGRVPRTEFTLTEPGRKALESYLAHMESLIRATRAPSGGR